MTLEHLVSGTEPFILQVTRLFKPSAILILMLYE